MITAQTVKDLREKTGAGMMDCKKALETVNGDMDLAIEWLRTQGIAKAAKKAGRSAREGMIADAISTDGTRGWLIEINCETDFVAKNAEFRAFTQRVTQTALTQQLTSLDAVLQAKLGAGSINDAQIALTATIGEHISVSRVLAVQTTTPAQKIAKYIHAGEKIGVLVVFTDPNGKLTADAAKDIAMHVAAMDPRYVRRDQVAAAVLDRERAIIREQLKDEKKPAEILDKIVAGRLNKFYAEQCLEEQIFVKDPQGKQTITQALAALDAHIRIAEVIRAQVGEKTEA